MATANPWSTQAWTSGMNESVYDHVGPPWTSITTGNGPGPGAGLATKPWMDWPAGLVNRHDSNGCPAGAVAPAASRTTRLSRAARTLAGWAPLDTRYQTSPSGWTA